MVITTALLCVLALCIKIKGAAVQVTGVPSTPSISVYNPLGSGRLIQQTGISRQGFTVTGNSGSPSIAWGSRLSFSNGDSSFVSPLRPALSYYTSKITVPAHGMGNGYLECGFTSGASGLSVRYDKSALTIYKGAVSLGSSPLPYTGAALDIALSVTGGGVSACYRVNSSSNADWHLALNKEWAASQTGRRTNGRGIPDFPDFTGYRPFFRLVSPDRAAWTISDFTCGYYGQESIRDLAPVVLRDGSPYMSGGYDYFTATATAPYWLATRMDVYRIPVGGGIPEKVGVVPLSYLGGVVGQHAGQILWDDRSGVWRVFASSWMGAEVAGGRIISASEGVVTLYGTTRENPLSGCTAPVTVNNLELPAPPMDGGVFLTTAAGGNGRSGDIPYREICNGVYDPAVRFDSKKNLWMMASVAQSLAYYDFKNQVAIGNLSNPPYRYNVVYTSPDLVTWTLVKSIVNPWFGENIRFVKFGETFYLATQAQYVDLPFGGQFALRGFLLYDLNLNFIQHVDYVGAGNPCIFPFGGKYILLSFDYTMQPVLPQLFGAGNYQYAILTVTGSGSAPSAPPGGGFAGPGRPPRN